MKENEALRGKEKQRNREGQRRERIKGVWRRGIEKDGGEKEEE